MKKAKPKKHNFGVDGPFEQAAQRVLDFGESLSFTSIIQATIEELEQCEEEYELALMMDDSALALKKRQQKEEILRTLAYASRLLEEEHGIEA
tara:strand:+ start:270 stop:548 length:279 start_codon:yes stop_codon:yes gene_type:complete